eukprot:CAMPEP_0175988998 /NCGR_PEP_ID=MMETSP0108-20121206/51539_1 /TAXON_ID=195067 ORGANISM="Goniomonas pacifica, Strain CCMP1869" /NCGR_SAMPLE_ID=MMETSP0108 /ASSEMBLY_ACC=CAM_ASM_000204 /LENGTH=71 /DNA_ID=CAMNT_0017320375 /DNA_START=68 /DNA_END=280 /DNA_ORIENTATION=+
MLQWAPALHWQLEQAALQLILDPSLELQQILWLTLSLQILEKAAIQQTPEMDWDLQQLLDAPLRLILEKAW